MILVYISGPYRAATPSEVEANIKAAADEAARWLAAGYSVICPHMNTRGFESCLPDKVFIDADCEQVKRSDVIVLLPGWKDSLGSIDEHHTALCSDTLIIEKITRQDPCIYEAPRLSRSFTHIPAPRQIAGILSARKRAANANKSSNVGSD